MADRRRIKQRKQAEQVKPSKEEYAIAKFLRFKIKAYDAKLHGTEVKYFLASEAVDALLSSKWAKGLGQGGILLTTRASCVSQMNNLLQKGCLFYRAEKVERRKHETKSEGKSKKSKEVEGGDKTGKTKGKDGNVSEGGKKSPKESSKSKSAKPDAESKTGTSKEQGSSKSSEKSKKDDEKKTKQRKVRLQMHEHQAFKDGEEYYVWIYDPVSWRTFIIGLLLLLGVIAVCLFPLWPPEVRIGISYLSWIAIGVLGFIFTLYIVRLIVFVVVWGASFGQHYLWLLPNLNEDVGFWDSFVPLYDHKLASDETAKKDEDSCSKGDGEANAADQEGNGAEGNKVESEEASAAEKECQVGDEETQDDKGSARAAGAGDGEIDNEEDDEANDSDQGGTGSEADNNDSDDERQTRRRRRPAAARHGTDIDIDVNTDNGFEMLDPEHDNGSDGSDLLGDSDDDKKDK